MAPASNDIVRTDRQFRAFWSPRAGIDDGTVFFSGRTLAATPFSSSHIETLTRLGSEITAEALRMAWGFDRVPFL